MTSPSRTVVGLLPLLAGAALLGGCKFGPDYKRPAVDAPLAYREVPTTRPSTRPAAATQASAASLADLGWWEVFDDPALGDLVKESVEKNYDLRVAVQRVEQARQVANQVRSELYPQVGYQAGLSRGKNEFQGIPTPNGGRTLSSVVAGVGAAWELDVWGRIRRSTEAALADYLATDEARRGVRLTLVTDVAITYLELVELDARLEISRRTSAAYGKTLDVFQQQFKGGVGSKLSVARADANVADTEAAIIDIERQIGIRENQLSILLGRNPGPIRRTSALLSEKALAAAGPTAPDVPAGLPSDLLERRPDIRQAEQEMIATNAAIGANVADYFPRLGLTTFLGRGSSPLDAFRHVDANIWSAGANLSGPIFEGGRIDASVAAARAAAQASRLRYFQTVQAAFADVSNALIARDKFGEAREQLNRRVASLQEAVKLANELLVGGRASYLEVIEAQQELYPAELALSSNRLNQRVSIIQLYRALGGGWRLETDEAWRRGEAGGGETPNAETGKQNP